MTTEHAIPVAPASGVSTRERSRVDSGADLVIVNEQLGDVGGTERVLAALMDRYPLARVIAPSFRAGNVVRGEEGTWAGQVEEVGSGSRKRHHLAPRYARWVARADIRSASVVLSLTHGGWGAAASIPPGARHLCYSAGLPRAFYGQWRDYVLEYSPPLRPLLGAALPLLRAHHRRMMRRPHRVLTNSVGSAAALAPLLGYEPEVVYPPVRTDYFTPATDAERSHFLVVARMRPQKRVDVVVDAFAGLDERLTVVGDGPWLERLRSRATSNVTFTGYVPDAELRQIYSRSHAVICPSVEEFGIVMAEAHASGVPVIAPRAGGALEIVADGETGLLIDSVGVGELREAVRATRLRSFDTGALRASAERFSVECFVERMEAVVDDERDRAAVAY
jgi:glycosyltransferase involved in cell wall biosynthesis